jgi:hypothetical protein
MQSLQIQKLFWLKRVLATIYSRYSILVMDGICNCNFGGSPIFEISRALYNKLDANPADVREQLLLPIVSNWP